MPSSRSAIAPATGWKRPSGWKKRANVATRGWFRIDPGECRQVVDGALDADMVYVHTRTPPVYGTAPLPQNGNADFCIRDGDFEIANARACR